MIGEAISHYRKQLGITQKELSQRTGVEVSRVCRTEKGKHENMQIENIFRYADGLGVDPCDLIKSHARYDWDSEMSLSAKARLAGVMGWPIGHSLSPRLHNYWLEQLKLDGVYVPLAVHPDHAADAIVSAGKMGFRGLNVTVPLKQIALQAVDSLEPVARRVGAVNTIVFDDRGKSVGTNTDGFGFVENIKHRHPGWRFSQGPAVVLGAGGAARAIVVALMDEGAPEIRICNRTYSRTTALIAALEGPENRACNVHAVPWGEREQALGGAAFLVNTTTLGMQDKEPLDIRLDDLPTAACVNDIVYTPLETQLLRAAYHRGNPTVDGIGMLLHQARPGFEAWFGAVPEVDARVRQHVLAGAAE